MATAKHLKTCEKMLGPLDSAKLNHEQHTKVATLESLVEDARDALRRLEKARKLKKDSAGQPLTVAVTIAFANALIYVYIYITIVLSILHVCCAYTIVIFVGSTRIVRLID